MGLNLNPPGGNGADPIGELREASPSGTVLIVLVVVGNTSPLFCQREPTGGLLTSAYSSSVRRCSAVAEGTLERFLAV